jgi:hypothetical protein
MAIPTYGGITLTALGAEGESVTLTTDPETYTLVWPNRRKRERVIGGVVTLEWPKLARDCVVHAESGQSQWLNQDVVQKMDRNDALTGETWRLVDFEGNDFVVKLFTWDPVKAKGMPDLYEYVLELEVLTMTNLRGTEYTGG